MQPENKIALVTGGSRGLGKDMVLRLAQRGADVVLTYLSKQAEAEAVVAEVTQMGRKALALPLDVANLGTLDAFITALTQALGAHFNAQKFDFLVNNGGVGATIPIAQVTEEAFDHLFNVHFKGVYFLTQKALPLMNDGGRVINVSSGTTRFSNPGYSVYASAKSAVETFTRYLAKEVGARGITANVVAPGPVATDFNGAFIRDNAQIQGFLSAQTALGRVGQPEDVGGVVAFLCSPEAGWINGQRIEVSGGILL